jgi:hypothetical protein
MIQALQSPNIFDDGHATYEFVGLDEPESGPAWTEAEISACLVPD